MPLIASDNLYKLIHTLSGAEKRYVKVFASKHLMESGNTYLLLFDAILEQKAYDEKALKLKFANTPLARRLAYEKNYLYAFILKAMRSFHSEKERQIQIREWLMDARYLFGKKLYLQSLKLLAKAKKEAEILDEAPLLIEVIQLEKEILLDKDFSNTAAKIAALNRKMESTWREYGLKIKLEAAHDRLHIILKGQYYMHRPEIKEEAGRIIKGYEFQDENILKGFSSRLLFLSSHILYYEIIADTEKVGSLYQEMIALWEAEPGVISLKPVTYRFILSNYLSYCHRKGDFEIFPQVLQKIDSIPFSSDRDKADHFKNVAHLELLFYLNSAQFEKALQLAPHIIKGLALHEPDISPSRRLAFYHNLCVLFFFQGQSREALHWLKMILDNEKQEEREDIQTFAKIFQLVIHYDLGNFDLLDYQLRSVKRYLQKNHALQGLYGVVISYITRLLDSMDKEGLKSIWQDFHQAIVELQEGDNVVSLGQYELLAWTMARRDCTTLIEVISLHNSEVLNNTELMSAQ